MSPGWERWLKHWEAFDAKQQHVEWAAPVEYDVYEGFSAADVEWPSDDDGDGAGAAKVAGFLRTADALDGAGARSAGAAKYGEMNWDKSGAGAGRGAEFLAAREARDERQRAAFLAGAGARSRTEYAEPSTPVAASGDCAPALVESLKSQIAALHLKIAQLEDEHKEEIRRICAAAARPVQPDLEQIQASINLARSSWANKWSFR